MVIARVSFATSVTINYFLPSDGCELTLDAGAVQKNLLLSEGNRKVAWVEKKQSHSHLLEKSYHSPQVLCQQGLDGRCYWEVEVFGSLRVGVTYKGTDKKVKMGHSDKSWCLVSSSDGFHVQHKSENIFVSSRGWRSSRVGMYLDWPAGTLSLYRVSADSQIHLHTFKTTFNKPLYPAVQLRPESSALFNKLT